MKVLSLVYDLIGGGTEGQCARVAMAHAQQGVEHQVAVMRRKGFFLQAVEEHCGPVYHFDIQKMISLDTTQKIKALAKYLVDEQIDLLHGWDMDAAIFGYPAARRAGIPFLASRRNMADMLPPHKSFMLKRIDRAAAGVVVNAEAIQNRIASWGCPEGNIHVIPNILDIEDFDLKFTIREKTEPPTIGLVCRLEPEKDVPCFLRAAAQLMKTHPAVQFEIVGEGSESASLEHMANDLGLAGHLRWLGAQDNVPEILAHWSVGALVPSKNEGLSNAILEYFAASIPCVATDNGGNRELIEKSGAGAVIPVGDADKLAQVWASWLDDNSATSSLGELGRAYVEREHRCVSVAQKFLLLYENLIAHE